jgi:hypothetical protein
MCGSDDKAALDEFIVEKAWRIGIRQRRDLHAALDDKTAAVADLYCGIRTSVHYYSGSLTSASTGTGRQSFAKDSNNRREQDPVPDSGRQRHPDAYTRLFLPAANGSECFSHWVRKLL